MRTPERATASYNKDFVTVLALLRHASIAEYGRLRGYADNIARIDIRRHVPSC